MPIAGSTQVHTSDVYEPLNFNDWFEDGSYAYFIGISEYQDKRINPLTSPPNDIESLKAVLEDKARHGFTVKNVEYKPADGQQVVLPNPLLNPGRQQLTDFVSNIQCGPESRVIVYFACHGIAENSGEDGKPEGFLIPSDAELGNAATYVKMSDVHAALSALKCKHLLIILDCCYAGAFKWTETTRGLLTINKGPIYFQKFYKYVSNNVRQVITSTSADQEAVDFVSASQTGNRGDGDKHVSPFAQTLVNALATGGADYHTDSDISDGLITVTEIGTYIKDKLDNEQLKQIPAVWNIGDDSKGEFIFLNPERPKRLLVKLGANRPNPFKGLESYTIKDRNIFFGRQYVLNGLQRGDKSYPGLIEMVQQNNIIAVTGRSGIGKSSLVRAGILSGLDAKIVKEIKPGPRPFTDNSKTFDALDNTTGYYLFVDQYEEIMTVCGDDNERSLFEKKLLSLSPAVKIIISLRSDFTIEFKKSPLIGDDCKIGRFAVPPFSRDDIKDIVTGVAGQQALQYQADYINPNFSDTEKAQADDDFTNRIIDDAYAYPDSLPLLSLALSRLFNLREMDDSGYIEYLTEKQYNKFGGITGIIEELAETEYRNPGATNTTDPAGQATPAGAFNLAQKQQLLLQLIFRMISFEGGERTKRRIYTQYVKNGISVNELYFNDEATSQTLKNICINLIGSRLLKSDRDDAGNEYIEPAHDALLRSWPQLSESLKSKDGQDDIPEAQKITNQDKVVLLRQVSELARTYFFEEPKKRKQLLWIKDHRLQQVIKLRGDYLRLNAPEESFINDSAKARKRSKNIRNIAVSALLIISVLITAYFIFLNNNIKNQLALSYWEQGISEYQQNDYVKSLLYTSEALTGMQDKALKQELLFNTEKALPCLALQKMIAPGKGIKDAQISADGKFILVVKDSLLQAWSADSGKCLYTTKTTQKLTEFSKKNDAILVTEKNALYILDFINNKKTLLYQGMDTVNTAHFFNDGISVAAAIDDSVFMWQYNNNTYRKKAVCKCPYIINTIDIANDGSWVATISDDLSEYLGTSFDIWGTDNHKHLYSFTATERYLAAYAKSSDSRKIFLAYNDSTQAILDIKKGKTIRFYKISTDVISAYFVKADSVVMLTANGTAILNTDIPGSAPYFFNTDPHDVSMVSPDTNHIIFLDDLGHIDLYSSSGGFEAAGTIVTKAISATFGDNKTVMAFTDNAILLYKIVLPAPVVLFKKPYYTVAFSDDYKSLVTLTGDSLHLWNLNTGLPVFSIRLKNDRPKYLYRVCGSDNSSAYCIIANDGRYLMDLSSDTLLNLNTEKIFSNPFSVDNRKMIYAMPDNSVHIRLSPYWRDSVLLPRHDKKVSSAGFIDDERAITFNDTSATIWSIKSTVKPIYSVHVLNQLYVQSDAQAHRFVIYLIDSAMFFKINTKDSVEVKTIRKTGKYWPYPSPGGDWLAVGPDLYKPYSGEKFNDLSFFDSTFYLFSDDDKYVARVDQNIYFSTNALVKIWNLASLKNNGNNIEQFGRTIKLTQKINEISFSPDDKKLLIFMNDKQNTCYLYDIAKAQRIATYKNDRFSFFSPDGERLYTYYPDDTDAIVTIKITCSDLDIPPALFKKQAIALTGSQLNLATGEVESLSQEQWEQLKKEYETEAAAHYKHCKYRQFNTWARIYPQEAAKE
ncbi:MAG TPA: caspase family protein [Chitinophagaceae bacterium]|nr:caspase family protein [Chitinophagaceae bacterium]